MVSLAVKTFVPLESTPLDADAIVAVRGLGSGRFSKNQNEMIASRVSGENQPASSRFQNGVEVLFLALPDETEHVSLRLD
jgi:hypothetical protein